jgi:hypothetical protein
LLLAVVMLMGRGGELMLGVVGLVIGALLTAALVGTDGIVTYLACVLMLRIMVWVLHEVLAYPLRVFLVLTAFTLVIWVVTR